jgi:predicted DNA-binding transcriptional regulator AlpA
VPQIAAIPSLDELAQNPAQASGLPAEALAALAARCVVVQGALAAAQLALVVNGGTTNAPVPSEGERMLDIKEAASKLGVKKDYLYRHKELPFRVNVSPGQLRFSLKGIEKFLRAKMAKGAAP